MQLTPTGTQAEKGKHSDFEVELVFQHLKAFLSKVGAVATIVGSFWLALMSLVNDIPLSVSLSVGVIPVGLVTLAIFSLPGLFIFSYSKLLPIGNGVFTTVIGNFSGFCAMGALAYLLAFGQVMGVPADAQVGLVIMLFGGLLGVAWCIEREASNQQQATVIPPLLTKVKSRGLCHAQFFSWRYTADGRVWPFVIVSPKPLSG